MRCCWILGWLIVGTVCSGAEPLPRCDWVYHSSGFESTDVVAMGRAGTVVTFTARTPDTVETVVQWYGRKLGLAEDHALMVAAKSGFRTLKSDLNGTWQIYHDTDARQDASLILAHAGSTHAHVTVTHRPSLDSSASVVISISQTPQGTSVVIVAPEDSRPALRGAQNP